MTTIPVPAPPDSALNVSASVTITSRVNNMINGCTGSEQIYLGSGTYNTFVGGKGKNVCHPPAPLSSYKGTAAAYYDDTITDCALVSL